LRRRKKNAMRMAPPSDFYFPRLWDLNLRKEWEVIRGLDGRGDRANGFFGIDPVDSNLSFNNFIVAFEGLIGSANLPTAAEMQQFTDFQLQVLPPPNPVRRLDNSLTSAQQRGRNF